MENHTAAQLVHSYDTEAHRVRCDASGDTRSTKHRAAVTCGACLDLLETAREAARDHDHAAPDASAQHA